jgi:hypothetical protein
VLERAWGFESLRPHGLGPVQPYNRRPGGSSSVGQNAGLQNRRSQVRVLAAPLLAFVPYLLFFLAGLGFGFAAVGVWKWLPVAFPLLLALATALGDGVDGALVLRLAVALVLTVGGVVLGLMLDRDQPQPRAEPGWR